MNNDINYFSPICAICECDPGKVIMISSLTGGDSNAISAENGSWGSNSGEQMGKEEGNW